MANITAAAAIKFSDQQVRVAANLKAQAFYPAIAAIDRWVSLGSGQTALDQMQDDLRNCANRILAAFRFAYVVERTWFGVAGLSALFPNDSSTVFDNPTVTAQDPRRPAITGGIVNNIITRSMECQNWLLGPAGSFTAQPQVETATAAGTITGAGNATVIVTANQMTGSPRTVSVAVANADTAATWAGKVRTALAADATVNVFFAVSGAGTAIVLTALVAAANDPSMNVSLANGTSTGITAAPTSANTTAGVATRNGGAWLNTVMQCSDYGPAVIVLSDAQNLVTRLGELKTNYQANTNANLNTILAAAVIPGQ